jgi:hypothetical protein
MYSIDEKIFNSILKKKFSSFVGNSCETIETLFKENLDKNISEKFIKDAVKKNAYNTMREISEQISAFSEGVNISIQFKKPVSK